MSRWRMNLRRLDENATLIICCRENHQLQLCRTFTGCEDDTEHEHRDHGIPFVRSLAVEKEPPKMKVEGVGATTTENK